MRADRRDPVIASLRRFKPARFEATLRDGTKKELALSSKQNRWELLSDTLSAIPWVSIEALDDKGAVLGALERDGDLEDEIIVDDDGARVDRFAAILASTVRETMKECRLMFGDTMKAHSEMAVSMLESQRVLHESYSLALKVQAATLPEGKPGEEDQVMKMLQMAMALQMGHKPAITVTASPPSKTPPATNGKKTA